MEIQMGHSKQRNWLGQAVVAAFALVMAVVISFLLYKYDNQYTQGSQQAENGVLDLRRANMDDSSRSYHLQKDWEFYPNVLLTPKDDFSAFPHELRSLRESSRDPREEQGTYRLRILLPDTPMSYALRLPTTFSSYRLYVNEELIHTIGSNGVEMQHKELFKGQILTFWASKEIQLLLHYDDADGIYNGLSGLSAPPIFGRPLRVYNEAEYHQFFLLSSMILILLILVLSISVYCRSRQLSNLTMIFLCVSAALYLAYPLLSGEMLVPVFPWYQLGMISYFSCHAAIHWTYSLYFEWKDRMASFVNWYSTAAVGLCAAFLLVTFFLPKEPGGVLFYTGMRLLQCGSVLCGMLLTGRMVASGAPNLLMGAASVMPWAFMLISLVTPDFSPILFARLPEIGIICFMDLSILVEYLDVATAHRFRILHTHKLAYVERLLKLEERYFTQLSDQMEETRRTRHDLRQHLRVIGSLLEQGDSAQLAAYLEQYVEKVQPLLEKPTIFYQIPIVDALIEYYWEGAQKYGADFQVKGQLHGLPQAVYVDFCSILGNLLENAMEALARQRTGESKWIRVQCEILQKKLILEVVNSNSAPIQQTEDYFQSTKRDDLGTGTLSVSIIARQYGGFASFAHEQGSFTAQVFLPLNGIPENTDRSLEQMDCQETDSFSSNGKIGSSRM